MPRCEYRHDSPCIEKPPGKRPSGMPRSRSKCPVAQDETMDYWVIPIKLGNELGNYDGNEGIPFVSVDAKEEYRFKR